MYPRTGFGRRWIAAGMVGAWMISAAFLNGMVRASTDHSHPNVLFVTIDDLNDWVGCLGGHPQAKTPHIDALARRGMLFTNAHCQAPVCNPSRVSFMTGKRPSQTGIYVNEDSFHASTALKGAVTLPRHFEANGYRTLGCGKLFHHAQGKDHFQHYGPSGGQGPLPPARLHCPVEQSASKLWDWGVFPPSEEDYHDVINSRWAAEQLESDQDGPFFLGVGFYRPHVPLYAPQRFFDQHPLEEVRLPVTLDGDMQDVPQAGRTLTRNPLPPAHAWFVASDQWPKAVQSYLASVSFVDDCVGRVLEALDKGPHRDNTWIVLFSDHGFFLGEKDRWAKQSLWERATKVPLIIVPPKKASEPWLRDKRCSKPVELLSLYPTLVEICDLSQRSGLDGRSLAPLLKDPDATWEMPAITTYQMGNHSLRTSRWRYTRYADGSEEIYDLLNDPHEWNNLAPGSDPSTAWREQWKPFFPVHQEPPPAKKQTRPTP